MQAVNDDSPRWGVKFDFVDITAGSALFFSVFDKPGALAIGIKVSHVA